MQHNTLELPTELTGLLSYLVRDGLISAATAKDVQKQAKMQNLTIPQYLIRYGIVSSAALVNYCAQQFGLTICDTQVLRTLDLQACNISWELIYRYRFLPLQKIAQQLTIAIVDPTDHATITAIGFHTGMQIQICLVEEVTLEYILQQHQQTHGLRAQFNSTLAKITPLQEIKAQQDITVDDAEPVTQLVEKLFHDAITKKVSDIHIEPFEQQCRIRFRHDGLLSEVARVPTHLANRVIARLKIMANLNIAERRLPQDGRIQQQGNKFDIRINTCPTLYGEKMVLRLLATKDLQFDMAALGMNPTQQEIFLTALNLPQGLIMVTGPTGSGKTLTLYSALHYLNQGEKNISTVEDPIEIEMPGINQVAINPKIGLDFASVLRTLLRQDPDIIMLGEIRDAESALIALQAAQTGHLVLATLHTNSAAETCARLQAMGMPNYQIANSISLIVAQRLIRKLCVHCKQVLNPTMPAPTYQPGGCEYCYNGFQGRTGLFELMPLTPPFKESILAQQSATQLHALMRQQQHLLLWEAGLQQVAAGVTSHTELLRVLGAPAIENGSSAC